MNNEIMIKKLISKLPEITEITKTINEIGITNTVNKLSNSILSKNQKYLKLFEKLPTNKQIDILNTLDKNLKIEVILSLLNNYKQEYYKEFIENPDFRDFLIRFIQYWRDFFELS